MNADAKKTALRMIPYGIYVLTADDGKGEHLRRDREIGSPRPRSRPRWSWSASAKADAGGGHAIIKAAKHFALNMLGKDQKGLAFHVLPSRPK